MTRVRTKRERMQAADRREARRRRTRMMWIAGVAAVVAVAGLILAGGWLRDDGAVQTVSAAQREGRVLGETSAPVIITVWEDFQCPVCKTANTTVLASIIEEYVDTGLAQVHFRHFAFLGDESVRAAEAAEAAAEQGMFWEYHDALYTYQGTGNRGGFSDDRLMQMAALVGLEQERFAEALNSREYRGVVEAEHREGQERGVAGTPTFFVNGERVIDWRDANAFRALIERFLPAGS